MSLTAGCGPFGRRRGGRFDFDAPDHVVYVEDFPHRVRAVIAGRVVIDTFSTSRRIRVTIEGVTLAETTRSRALYETGLPGRFYMPSADVDMSLLDPRLTRSRARRRSRRGVHRTGSR